jgi:hypothetical protein
LKKLPLLGFFPPRTPLLAPSRGPLRPAPGARLARDRALALSQRLRPTPLLASASVRRRVLADQPPETGGRNATSSPSCSRVVSLAYSSLTAQEMLAP